MAPSAISVSDVWRLALDAYPPTEYVIYATAATEMASAEVAARAGVSRQISSTLETVVDVRASDVNGVSATSLTEETREASTFAYADLIRIDEDLSRCATSCIAVAVLELRLYQNVLAARAAEAIRAGRASCEIVRTAHTVLDGATDYWLGREAAQALIEVQAESSRAGGEIDELGIALEEIRTCLDAARQSIWAGVRTAIHTDEPEMFSASALAVVEHIARDAGAHVVPTDETFDPDVEITIRTNHDCRRGMLGHECRVQVDLVLSDLRAAPPEQALISVPLCGVAVHPRSEAEALILLESQVLSDDFRACIHDATAEHVVL